MQTYQCSPETLYVQAGRRISTVLASSLSNGESILLFLSGGSAVRVYPQLVDYIKKNLNRSFSEKLAVVQVDERLRPQFPISNFQFQMKNRKNSDINAEVIGKTGLWDVCKEKGIACHLISQAGTMEESSSEYNLTISRLWNSASKKFAVLGIGEDGHTAGLLPGYQSNWDVDRFVIGYKNDGPFQQRISLTPKALRSLDYALVVAAGVTKRPMLDQLSSGKETDLNCFPAGILRQMKEVEIFADIKM